MLSRENRDTKARKTQRDRKAKLLLERETSSGAIYRLRFVAILVP